MSSYLHNIFTPQPLSQPHSMSGHDTKPKPRFDSHQRSRSTSNDLSYIYAPSGKTDVPLRPKPNINYTASRPTTSSSLRFATASSERAPVYRSASFKAGEPVLGPKLYPKYTPSVSFSSSSRTSSTTSLHHSSLTPTSTRSTTSSRSGHRSRHASLGQARQPRSSLNHSGNSRGLDQPHAQAYSHSHTPSQSTRMHPLIAHSLLNHASISYDVTFPPSERTVLDRNTRMSIAPHSLTQPATEPPTSSRILLKTDKLPWTIPITASSPPCSGESGYYISPTRSRSRSPSRSSRAISTEDVLMSLHIFLHAPITTSEWASLGQGSKRQRKVTRAYEERCVKMGGGWEGGVRRIDWLCGKTRFVGVEVDRFSDRGGDVIGRPVFGKA